ncbi:MAG: hypothetical protein OXU20_10440 [Myxococcales bacterium]|nr:hypothetical protein [Myxococcales bacterium]
MKRRGRYTAFGALTLLMLSCADVVMQAAGDAMVGVGEHLRDAGGLGGPPPATAQVADAGRDDRVDVQGAAGAVVENAAARRVVTADTDPEQFVTKRFAAQGPNVEYAPGPVFVTYARVPGGLSFLVKAGECDEGAQDDSNLALPREGISAVPKRLFVPAGYALCTKSDHETGRVFWQGFRPYRD